VSPILCKLRGWGCKTFPDAAIAWIRETLAAHEACQKVNVVAYNERKAKVLQDIHNVPMGMRPPCKA
jgi:hypothetical protein